MTPDRHSGGFVAGGRRNRIQSQLKAGLQQFPAVETVVYADTRTGIDKELRAECNCDILLGGDLEVEKATLVVNWWTHSEGSDDFTFHYYDSSGYDCGWHRHENEHVDGMDHLQWRSDSDEEYHYEPIQFDFDQPPGVLWEVRDRLYEHLSNRV